MRAKLKYASDGRVRATVESASLLTGEKVLSLDFVRDVLDASDGRGVDVVLNSLGGEFIPASLLVSWLAYRLYDVPVRRALRRLESRRAMVPKASPV